MPGSPVSAGGRTGEKQNRIERYDMPDYKKMYLKMFNAAEDAINAAEQAAAVLEKTAKALIAAQQECEEMYISGADDEPELEVLTFPEQKASEGV